MEQMSFLAHAHHMQITLTKSHDTCWDSIAITVALQGIFLSFHFPLSDSLFFFHGVCTCMCGFVCERNAIHNVGLFKPRGFPWFLGICHSGIAWSTEFSWNTELLLLLLFFYWNICVYPFVTVYNAYSHQIHNPWIIFFLMSVSVSETLFSKI